jgi:hypothetical protein
VRRSPIRHPVKSHERGGVQVSRYERGKGTRPAQRATVNRSPSSKGYKVTFQYGDSRESHDVDGPTFTQAVIQGTALMTEGGYPTKVIVRRLN